MLTMYLAGSIRNNKPEDYIWRNKMIEELGEWRDRGVLRILNPMAQQHQEDDGKWYLSGHEATPPHIVHQGLWEVNEANILVFNFLSLADGYISAGTFTEWGASTVSRGKLRYAIWPRHIKGHENEGMYKLHPFIEQNAAHVFDSVEECIDFMKSHIGVLSGMTPYYFNEKEQNSET